MVGGRKRGYLNDTCVEALGRGLHSTACNVPSTASDVLFYRLWCPMLAAAVTTVTSRRYSYIKALRLHQGVTGTSRRYGYIKALRLHLGVTVTSRRYGYI